jgi:hypothetical protein
MARKPKAPAPERHTYSGLVEHDGTTAGLAAALSKVTDRIPGFVTWGDVTLSTEVIIPPKAVQAEWFAQHPDWGTVPDAHLVTVSDGAA